MPKTFDSSYKMQLDKYKEIFEAEGVSCVELWKSYEWPKQYKAEMDRRIASYKKEDWEQMKLESAEVVWQFIDIFRKNLPVWSEEAMAAAEANKNLIDKWWHPNTYEFEVWMAKTVRLKQAVGQFENRPGFWDKFEAGLGEYVYDCILWNAGVKTNSLL